MEFNARRIDARRIILELFPCERDDLDHIGSGLCIGVYTFDRLHSMCLCSGTDHEVLIFPRAHRGSDLSAHFFNRYFTRCLLEKGTIRRQLLVFNKKARQARLFKFSHRAISIDGISVAAFHICHYWDLDCLRHLCTDGKHLVERQQTVVRCSKIGSVDSKSCCSGH